MAQGAGEEGDEVVSDGDIIGAIAPKREAERKWSKGPWQWGYSFEADLSRWALRASGNPLSISGRTHRAIANRNLIASAPDLYEALEAILEKYTQLVNCGDCGFWDPETEGEVIAARSALCRARGETP